MNRGRGVSEFKWCTIAFIASMGFFLIAFFAVLVASVFMAFIAFIAAIADKKPKHNLQTAA